MSVIDEQAAQRAEARAAQLAESLPYIPGPFVPGSFSVGRRDTHHFDIYAERRPGYVQWFYSENPDTVAYPMRDGGKERAFAIRGEPGEIYLRDERWDYTRPFPRPSLTFPSVECAMLWVVKTLMTGAA